MANENRHGSPRGIAGRFTTGDVALKTDSELQRCWWQVQDSNLRRRKPTDLQSIPGVCGRFPLTGLRAGSEPGLA